MRAQMLACPADKRPSRTPCICYPFHSPVCADPCTHCLQVAPARAAQQCASALVSRLRNPALLPDAIFDIWAYRLRVAQHKPLGSAPWAGRHRAQAPRGLVAEHRLRDAAPQRRPAQHQHRQRHGWVAIDRVNVRTGMAVDGALIALGD